MISVKVLGPGCKNCERLELHALQAVEQLQADTPGLEVAVQKVKDVAVFVDYGLLTTPGLVINEKLVASGRIPALDEIAGWMRQAAAA